MEPEEPAVDDVLRVVFDIETTITNDDPSAFVPENKAVMCGYRKVEGSLGKGVAVVTYGGGRAMYVRKAGADDGSPQKVELIGHNMAFDMQYLLRDSGLKRFAEELTKSQLEIWDTQIAEYVLSGQTATTTSLDELAVKYGGTVKDSAVSKYFKDGLGADHVPKDMLKDYLEGDLLNTEVVYHAQVDRAEEQGQCTLIKMMCHARMMTALMQHVGMYVNVDGLSKFRDELGVIVETLRTALASTVRNTLIKEFTDVVREAGVDVEVDILSTEIDDAAMTSPLMLSSFLFGGDVTLNCRVPYGEYKSGAKKGMKKYRRRDVTITFPRLFMPTGDVSSSRKYSLKHSVDDAVLKSLRDPTKNIDLRKFIDRTIELRRAQKVLSTYVDGILGAVYLDSRVHQNFNHTVTATGRLSCSAPNLQNQDDDVKPFFEAKLPDGTPGLFLEVDFKQLEIWGLAQLSRDPQLISDLLTGTDLHYETGRTVFGWRSPSDMDDKTRRGVKGVNFGLIYGGSAKGLAETTGFPFTTVKALINSFYTRYPGVKEWQERNIAAVKAGRVYEEGGPRTEKGMPAGQSVLSLDTGRRFVFTEYDAPDWMAGSGDVTSFSPTQIKNYPVQGFATGDVVPITLAAMLEHWAHHYTTHSICRYLPCNTVHDSMKFLVEDEVAAAWLLNDIRTEIIPGVETVLKNVFGIDIVAPLKVDAKIGPTWGSLKKFEPT